MPSARYRLRFVTGVSFSAATYGSGNYGDGTYGMQATDPLAALDYRAYPFPAGGLNDPSWSYRQGDTAPDFYAQVLSELGPSPFVGVSSAQLILAPVDGSELEPLVFDLDVRGDATGREYLARTWLPGDLSEIGQFRAVILLLFESSRRMSIPTDDRHTFLVSENPRFVSAEPAAAPRVTGLWRRTIHSHNNG